MGEKECQTFSERKDNKRRVTQLERDKKIILSAMNKKMEFSRKTKSPVDKPGEQLLELPLTISDNDGKPLKGQISAVTKVYEHRYKQSSPAVYMSE